MLRPTTLDYSDLRRPQAKCQIQVGTRTMGMCYPHLCVDSQSTHACETPKPSRFTHATPTWRPPGPWPLLAEPYYCGTL